MHTNADLYVHPAPVRVWHWINALGFILLILTGLQIRFAEVINILSLKDAIALHNYVGFIVIADYLFWLAYYYYTGRIQTYFPNLKKFPSQAVKQARYYGYGIFKGEDNPFVITQGNKFNPLQKMAYIGLMFVLVPIQMITGLFLWQVKSFAGYIDVLGGIKIVDSVHVLLFFFFAAFLVIHCYLATLGHTPWAHFKAMFTGFEERHLPTEDPALPGILPGFRDAVMSSSHEK